jgi:hypothetical protein
MKRSWIYGLVLTFAILITSTPALATTDSAGGAAPYYSSDVVVQPLSDRICPTVSDSLNRCGGVQNLSGTAIVAYKSWCDGAPCSSSHQRRLLRGAATPWYEDWDAVWVPCRAAGYKDIAGLGRYPWAGGSGYHRVRDPEHLVVTTVFC